MRLSGNNGEVVIVDRGLTGEQRRRLAKAATVVDMPDEAAATHPLAVKPSVYLLQPDGVVILVDSDMIVTRPLDDLVERAREGKIVVFPDHFSKYGRWFAEWEQVFGLAGAPRRGQRYVNAGLVALSADRRPSFLPRWYEAASRIPPDRIQRDPADAFWAADQDALNAILKSEIAPEDIWIGPEWASVHPDGLRSVSIVDRRSLRCTFRGGKTTALHFSLGPKPWQRGGWRRIEDRNAYVTLMPRVLFDEDVALRADPADVPVWARPGRRADLVRKVLGLLVSSGYGAKRLGLKGRDAAHQLLTWSSERA